jgi:hypothetical protein
MLNWIGISLAVSFPRRRETRRLRKHVIAGVKEISIRMIQAETAGGYAHFGAVAFIIEKVVSSEPPHKRPLRSNAARQQPQAFPILDEQLRRTGSTSVPSGAGHKKLKEGVRNATNKQRLSNKLETRTNVGEFGHARDCRTFVQYNCFGGCYWTNVGEFTLGAS